MMAYLRENMTMKILLLITLAIAVCFTVYAAGDSRNGVWTAELIDDKVQMTLFRGHDSGDRRGMGFNNIMGFDDVLSAYTGLTKADLLSTAANVQFELRRAAGVIAFEGRVANGTGAGHYRFAPSDAFIRDMDTLGYRGFSDDQLLLFAAHAGLDSGVAAATGGVAFAVIASVAAIGVPAGWYGPAKASAVVIQPTTAAVTVAPTPELAVPTESSQTSDHTDETALAARRQHEKEKDKAKAREEKAAGALTANSTASVPARHSKCLEFQARRMLQLLRCEPSGNRAAALCPDNSRCEPMRLSL